MGGAGAFLNWRFGANVTKAVAIDFYGVGAVTGDFSWIQSIYETSGAENFALKIYTSCDSPFYMTEGILPPTDGTFIGEAGLVQQMGQPTTPSYGGYVFKEYLWKNA